jgi:hypothetical protein
MKNLFCQGLLLLGLLCHGITAFAGFEQEEAAELQRYIEIFQGSSVELQKDVCNELQWKGIIEVRLYDVIEEKLKALLPGNLDREEIETAAWYAKGLGTSGMEKYRPLLLEMLAKRNEKLVRYAKEGIEKIGQYSRWNPIISEKKNFRDDQPLQVNRYANMLRSEDDELKIVALKRIHYDHVYDEYLLDILRDELVATHKKMESGTFNADLFNWMVRSLSGSRNRKYFDGLKEIYATLPRGGGLHEHARKMLKGYYDYQEKGDSYRPSAGRPF